MKMKLRRNFSRRVRESQADEVEALENEIDATEANPFEAGALVRRNQAQDKSVYHACLHLNEF